MSQKTIVILGGGIGGIVTARDLRKHLGTEHRIILIDKRAHHTFQPSYLWVVVGWRTPAAISKPFTALEKHGVEFLQSEVRSINPERKQVETDKGTVLYDYLVVALGTDNDASFTTNPSAGIHSFYSFEQAVELSKVIPTFTGESIDIVIHHTNYKYPMAPYDAAFLISSFFSKRGIDKVRVNIFTPETEPVLFAGSQNSKHLRALLHQHNIGLHTNCRLDSIDSNNRTVRFNNSVTNRFDLLIGIPSYSPPAAIRQSNLSDEFGLINVVKDTLQTSIPYVWAIGDNIKINLENGVTLPKAGVFANNQAEIVAFNIAHEILGSSQKKAYSGYGFFFIETGNSRAAYLHGNFFTKPEPTLSWIEPNVTFHWGKVVIEKYWLWRWL